MLGGEQPLGGRTALAAARVQVRLIYGGFRPPKNEETVPAPCSTNEDMALHLRMLSPQILRMKPSETNTRKLGKYHEYS